MDIDEVAQNLFLVSIVVFFSILVVLLIVFSQTYSYENAQKAFQTAEEVCESHGGVKYYNNEGVFYCNEDSISFNIDWDEPTKVK